MKNSRIILHDLAFSFYENSRYVLNSFYLISYMSNSLTRTNLNMFQEQNKNEFCLHYNTCEVEPCLN